MNHFPIEAFFAVLAGMALAPLNLGVINKVKAFFAGRKGPPLTQLYSDLAKLAGKGAVYSRTTTWIFRFGPAMSLATTVLALAMLPLGKTSALVAFPGDFVVVAYLLGLGRFFVILAALDTGSSFEGMGASREAKFSAIAEPALLLSLLAVLTVAPHEGLTPISAASSALFGAAWLAAVPVLCLVAVALFIVLLAENSRIPVDDPNTHLELTMIHEVMVLDHGGPDFALIQYGAALKLWVTSCVLVAVLIPWSFSLTGANALVGMIGISALAVAVGLVESSMARLRLTNVSQLLTAAIVLAGLAALLALSGALS